MAVPSKAYENLSAQIIAAGARVHAGLTTPSPATSAALLMDCAGVLQRLASQTRQAALTAQAAVLHPKAV